MENAYHILRYGTHADQKFFIKAKDTYSTIAINGNMIAHSPAAIASFVSNMKLQNPKLTYFIDPITHAFQHDLIRLMTEDKKATEKVKVYDPEKLKKSIKSLINCYGNNLSRILIDNKRTVFPSDFDSDFIKEFCSGVIDFQHNVLTNELKKRGAC